MSDFFDRTLETLRNGPLGPLVRWMEDHPRLSSWIVLAVGMVTLVVIQARDVGLQPSQWAAVIIATILVAGACVLIISWEDEDEEETSSKSDAVSPVKAEAEQKTSSAEMPVNDETASKVRKTSARTPTRKPTDKKVSGSKKSK